MPNYRLRPSFAPVWVNCRGAVKMSEPYPQDDSPAAREGTAGHWVAMMTVLGRQPAIGALCPNGEVVSEEMLEGADLYLEAVEARMPAGMAHVEEEVAMPAIHAENGGTVDLWGLAVTHDSNSRPVLHVFDYKFGHGYVDEFENWQCLDYVSGVVSKLLAEGVLDPATVEDLIVEMTVVQPRYYGAAVVRSWRITLRDLRGHFNILRDAAAEAVSDDPKCRTGAWCEYCPGRHACTTLQRAAMSDCDKAGSAIPFNLSAAQVGAELRLLQRSIDRMKARATGLEVEALSKIKAGEPVPNFAAESSVGAPRWVPGMEAEALAMGELMGVDLAKPRAPIAVGKAKKLIDEAVISGYTFTPRGETKLVAVDNSKTRKLFGATKP